MLIGLVTKNGILIVEFARQRQEAGATVLEAAREGAAARFRPILMTSAATVLGTLPIALALGAGAESRTPMGLAVIGGLTVGTLLSLFVVPAMYTYFAGKHAHVETEEEAAAPVALAADGSAVPPGGDGAADLPREAASEEAADA
jgi:multidrug efflux pump